MNIQQIKVADLAISKANVRKSVTEAGIPALAASIRNHGLFHPLLVRPEAKGFGIVAGQRRYMAIKSLAENENDAIEEVPCVVLAEGDDAAAIEASLAENSHMAMDPIDQFNAFNVLARAGHSVAEIAARFAVPEATVSKRLAIANLLPKIKAAYQAGDIDAQTLQLLTRATKRQQTEWLKLFEDPNEHAPTHGSLKHWLHGADISVDVALFDLERYKGKIITDLFEEKRVFGSSDEFWTAQRAAIEERMEAYRADGWADAHILDIGTYFSTYNGYTAVSKDKGGHVYIECNRNGEIEFHEGFLTDKEAKKLQSADGTQNVTPAPARPETTKAMDNYIRLHRHAVAQVALVRNPSIALRLTVANMLACTTNFDVRADGRHAEKPEIAESAKVSKARTEFEAIRAAVLKSAGMKKAKHFGTALHQHRYDETATTEIFAKLMKLDDATVMEVMAVAAAESLSSAGSLVNAVGHASDADIGEFWCPDDTFYDLLKDKGLLNAMIAELGGEQVAAAHAKSTGKVMRSALRQLVEKESQKKDRAPWLSRFMQGWPRGGYSETSMKSAATYATRLRKLFG